MEFIFENSYKCSAARRSAAKTNVNWLDAFPTHRLMTFAAALGGEVLLALVAFDLLLKNFYFPY